MAYCSLEDENSRVLEVPLWMLDVAVCSKAAASAFGPETQMAYRRSIRLRQSSPLGYVTYTNHSEVGE